MHNEAVNRALAHVIDEEHQKPFFELGLIRDVVIRDHHVALTLLIHTGESDRQAYYHSRIVEELQQVGIDDAHIRIKWITKEEKDRIVESRLHPITVPKRKLAPASTSAPIFKGVRFLAIASGKGGVGKSTVTVNTAIALSRAGKRVGVIDADIYGYSIPNMLGITDKPRKINNRIQPVERCGIHVISTGFFVDSNSPVIWRGPMLGKMLSTFLNEVEWPELDYLLIDLPPGTGDVALYVHQNIPQCAEIIVTTPHSTASFVAERAGAMAQQTQHHIVGVVENMSYFEDDYGKKHYLFGKGGGAHLAELLHTSMLAQIPISAPDQDAAEADLFPAIYGADTRNGHHYAELAQHIINHL